MASRAVDIKEKASVDRWLAKAEALNQRAETIIKEATKAYLIHMSANVGQMATGFDQLSRRIEATLDDYDHEMSRLLAHYNNFE